MATKVVTAPVFPVGTDVKVYPWEITRVEQRQGRVPFDVNSQAFDGEIGAGHSITVTADPGKYIMLGVVNEVVSVAVDATAGQFKLVFGGQTTADIAFNAAAATATTAFEALSTVGAGNAVITGGPGNSGGTTPYIITFLGDLAGTNVGAVTAAAGTTPLSGGGAAVVIGVTTAGAEGTSGELIWVAFTVDA